MPDEETPDESAADAASEGATESAGAAAESSPESAKPAPKAEPKPRAERAAPAEKGVVAAGGARAVAAAGAGGPAVVVVPQPAPGPALPAVSRRRVLQIAFWSGMGAMLLGIVYTILNSVYPRGVTGFGGSVFAGTLDQLPPGSKLRSLDAQAWIVRFDAEQARLNNAQEGAVLALWHKCPHLGCTVPFLDNFSFEDPRVGETYQGWFRCPCHGSTYSDAGVRVFGPAPRSMDTFALTIDGGNLIVDTGSIMPGGEDNGSRAILPS
jgi:cytochrome b6-f complex iron-sulfur subunit